MSAPSPNHDTPDGTLEVDSVVLQSNFDPAEDSELPEFYSERRSKAELYAEHRKKFNLAAFGSTLESGAIGKPRAVNKRIWTKLDYENHIDVIRYWNLQEGHKDPATGEHISQEEYRRKHGRHWYRLSKIYRIVQCQDGDGTMIEQLKRQDEKSLEWKVCAHEENVYDAILECHEVLATRKYSNKKRSHKNLLECYRRTLQAFHQNLSRM